MNLEKYKHVYELSYKLEDIEENDLYNLEDVFDMNVKKHFSNIIANYSVIDIPFNDEMRIKHLELFVLSNEDMLKFLEHYDSLNDTVKEAYKLYLTSRKDYNKRLEESFNVEMKFRI